MGFLIVKSGEMRGCFGLSGWVQHAVNEYWEGSSLDRDWRACENEAFVSECNFNKVFVLPLSTRRVGDVPFFKKNYYCPSPQPHPSLSGSDSSLIVRNIIELIVWHIITSCTIQCIAIEDMNCLILHSLSYVYLLFLFFLPIWHCLVDLLSPSVSPRGQSSPHMIRYNEFLCIVYTIHYTH